MGQADDDLVDELIRQDRTAQSGMFRVRAFPERCTDTPEQQEVFGVQKGFIKIQFTVNKFHRILAHSQIHAL